MTGTKLAPVSLAMFYGTNRDFANAFSVRVDTEKESSTVYLTFIDSGVPYDPLEKGDPDVTLSAEERKVGGLGIYMVKKSVDDIRYEYRDGQNIVTVFKRFREL